MLMLINKEWLNNSILENFNTSHVNVNRKACYRFLFDRKISIHLMLMLIIIRTQCQLKFAYFNTSHVNVNHAPQSNEL